MREHVFALAAAILLDAILGDPEHWPHPVRWIGAGYSFFEKTFQRFGDLKEWHGIVTVILISAFSAVVPFLCLHWVKSSLAHWVIESFLFYLCLSVKSLSQAAKSIEKALRRKRMSEARVLLSRVVGRDTKRLSISDLSRAVVETIGESFVDGFLSPVFWGFLGGAPAAFFFKAVSTGDSMIGHPEPPYRKYGWAAARLDDAMNFIPARLGFFILAPACFFSGLSVDGFFRAFWKDRLKHASPNAAHGESAFAGALDVRLGGINFYSGKSYRQEFLNASGRPCKIADIHEAVRLLWSGMAVVTTLLIFIGCFISYMGCTP